MLNKQCLKDLDPSSLAGKTVFVRVDFNVPFQEGQISDDSRIKAALPTIQYLKDHGAKTLLASHLGRPKGQVDDSLRLAPVAERLSSLLGTPVHTVSDCIGPEVDAAVATLHNGDILCLENVRFHSEETDNHPEFAKQLAKHAELFVNDAFGTAHRAHASTEGVGRHIPSVAGFLIEKEINFLDGAIQSPKRPLVAIIGGSKVSSKFGVLRHLLGKVDTLVIGGGMTYTFLKAQGNDIGTSLCEDDLLEEANAFLEQAQSTSTKVVFPIDHTVAGAFDNSAPTQLIDGSQLPSDMMGLDVGPKTVALIQQEVASAGTVLWNGPLGVFEMSQFAKGTFAVAESLSTTSAITIVGGGDSVAAVNKAGVAESITHISTGGGASLEFLEGRDLPGLSVLQDRHVTENAL